jgi:hypothetical protein
VAPKLIEKRKRRIFAGNLNKFIVYISDEKAKEDKVGGEKSLKGGI